MAENEIGPQQRPVTEHWQGGLLLSRHWTDQSDGCVLCDVAKEKTQTQMHEDQADLQHEEEETHVSGELETKESDPTS